MRTRIKRAKKHMEKLNLDAIVVFNISNLAYFSGRRIDYSAAVIAGEEVHLVVHALEEERGRKAPLVTQTHVYSPYPPGKRDVIVGKIEEAVIHIVRALGLDEGRIGYEGDKLPVRRFELMKKGLKRAELIDASEMIWELRMIKDEEEILAIKGAGDVAVEGIVAAFDAIEVGKRELDVAAEVLRAMAKKGGLTDTSPIIASGPRSSAPHAVASEKKIEDNEFVVIDLCPRYHEYHSDMTRTVFVGRADREQRRIYDAVRGAQMDATDFIRPGVTAGDVDRIAREALKREGLEKRFIHSTGHGIGLDVHEPPKLSSRDSTVLQAGMVVSIEPGVYIPQLGGVRIEDTVLVTEKGARVLTEFPRDLIEI